MERTKHRISLTPGKKHLAEFQQPLKGGVGGNWVKERGGVYSSHVVCKIILIPSPQVNNLSHKVVVKIIEVRIVMHFVHQIEMIH